MKRQQRRGIKNHVVVTKKFLLSFVEYSVMTVDWIKQLMKLDHQQWPVKLMSENATTKKKKSKQTNKKNQKQLRFQWRRCSSKRLSVILMQPGISSHTRSDTWLICQTVNWPVNKIHVRPCRSQKEREKTKHNKQQVWGLCWDIDDKRLLQAPGAWKLRSSKISAFHNYLWLAWLAVFFSNSHWMYLQSVIVHSMQYNLLLWLSLPYRIDNLIIIRTIPHNDSIATHKKCVLYIH